MYVHCTSYSSLLYSTAAYCILQLPIVFYSSLLYSTAAYCILQQPIVSYDSLLYSTAAYCILRQPIVFYSSLLYLQQPIVFYSSLLYSSAAYCILQQPIVSYDSLLDMSILFLQQPVLAPGRVCKADCAAWTRLSYSSLSCHCMRLGHGSLCCPLNMHIVQQPMLPIRK